jgi:transposase
MLLDSLCPDPATWRIAVIAPERDRLVLHLEPMRPAVACPVCGTGSRRVRSRYRRKPWDLPWGHWPVQLVVHARRFYCDVPACLRRIFVEPFPRILARGYQRKTRLHTLLAEHDAAAFDQWLQGAETSGLPPFRTLARSFRQDYAAIVAALRTPWSTGQCEGQSCRVKLIKRLGDGRAKLDLLRQRILHRIATPMQLVGRGGAIPAAGRRIKGCGHEWRLGPKPLCLIKSADEPSASDAVC